MNPLTTALADACRKHMLADKWLLAPSRRVGHQWLGTVARHGQAVLNVRVKTLRSLALELAGPLLAESGLKLATARPCGLMLLRALRELRPTLEYLGGLEPNASLAETVLASIDALRLAGLEAVQITKDRFEVSDKGQDIAAIAESYLRLLDQEEMVDYAAVLEVAVRRLSDEPGCIEADTLVLVPDDLDCAALETKLLEAFPERSRTVFPADAPDLEFEAATDLERMRWLLKPGDAPSARRDGTVQVVRAIGEVNEVRHVLRQCVSQGIALDDVELLHTNADTYVPLVHETLAALRGEDHDGGEPAEPFTAGELGLPVTFNEGIPADSARPGRALRHWLRWIQEGFAQSRLLRMLEEGLLVLPDDDEQHTGCDRLANVLRGAGIGFGRDRYVAKLDERIKVLEQRGGPVDDEESVEQTPAAVEQLRRDLKDSKRLRILVERLLGTAPSMDAPAYQVLDQARQFIEQTARRENHLDGFAAQRLAAELADMAHWLEVEDFGIDVWQWLEALPRTTRVLGSGPRPGCLHVDSIHSGGHSGRPHTFILGLDDGRFPGTGAQDPLLLDGERRRLSKHLTTAVDRLEKRVQHFARLLRRIGGHLTLSYSCLGLDDDRDVFPSPVLLPVFRLLCGRDDAEQQDLMKSLPAPVSFAPGVANACLDTNEWWQWRLTGPRPVRDAAALVMSRFDHLSRGQEAAAQRATTSFTAFDGHVPSAGQALDPVSAGGRVVSARMLETLGTCPRRFFFRYALDIEPPEDLSLDTQQWLDGRARGALLHALFEQFMRELVNKQQTPKYDRDHEYLEALLARLIGEYEDLYPPPAASAFQRQCDELKQTAHTYLRAEEDFCLEHGSGPLYVEASLGMPPDEHGSPLDTNEPVPVRLVGGAAIRARGRVDRIDRIGGGAVHTYGIWDYKTGSDWGYERNDPFVQGRKVQPYLYVTIAGHCLRQRVSEDARVEYFGFFFPGVRTDGSRMQWTPDELRRGPEILGHLCRIVANGAFVATDDAADCKYCDYRAICGDVETLAQESCSKMNDDHNDMLEPFRTLRTIDA